MCPHNIQEFSRQSYAHWISPTEKRPTERCLYIGLLFLVSVGPSLQSNHQGKLLLINGLQESIFKQCVTLSTQNPGKAMFLQGRKGINRECVFRPLSLRICLYSKIWDLQTCPEDPTSRARAECFPANSEPCNRIPRSHRNAHEETDYGRVSEHAWCHTALILWADIPLEIGQGIRVTSHLLLQKSQRVKQSHHCQK